MERDANGGGPQGSGPLCGVRHVAGCGSHHLHQRHVLRANALRQNDPATPEPSYAQVAMMSSCLILSHDQVPETGSGFPVH